MGQEQVLASVREISRRPKSSSTVALPSTGRCSHLSPVGIQTSPRSWVMVNGSFVFGMDDDDEAVFDRTVEWASRRELKLLPCTAWFNDAKHEHIYIVTHKQSRLQLRQTVRLMSHRERTEKWRPMQIEELTLQTVILPNRRRCYVVHLACHSFLRQRILSPFRLVPLACAFRKPRPIVLYHSCLCHPRAIPFSEAKSGYVSRVPLTDRHTVSTCYPCGHPLSGCGTGRMRMSSSFPPSMRARFYCCDADNIS